MPSEKAKMLRGEPYDPTDTQLVAERERAREIIRDFNDAAPTATEHRRELLEELFGSTGANPYVEPPIRCDYGSNITVGDDFYANFDCVFLDGAPIEFGDDCLLGPGVHVYTATHPLDANERRAGLESARSITIGDDVWIGGNAVLNPGVDVGPRSVIGSGAVVTEDVPADVVVQGNPATVVRELE